MWNFIGWGIAGFFTFGGWVYGLDQHSKRKSDRKRYQKEIKRLERKIEDQEQKLAALKPLLFGVFGIVGKKNDQVRKCCDEIKRLRAELADARRQAAA